MWLLYIILMHIFSLCFFCQWVITCHLFYIYFRVGNDVKTKSKVKGDFLEFKNESWSSRAPAISTMHLAQDCKRTYSAVVVQESLAKTRGWGAQHAPLRSWHQPAESHHRLILLQLPKKRPNNSMLTILWSFGIC